MTTTLIQEDREGAAAPTTVAATATDAAHANAAPAATSSAGILPFTSSTPFTMGIELELQLVNRRNYNLASDAVDLLTWIAPRDLQKQIKLEMTQGMIELNSGIHTRVDDLIEELKGLRAALNRGAQH